MKSTREVGTLQLFTLALVLLAACAGSNASGRPAEAAKPQPSTTQGDGASLNSPEMRRQVERLDRLEALVTRFDTAVAHLEQVHGEWGFAQSADLNDILGVVEKLEHEKGAGTEGDLPASLEPRLEAMVTHMKGISARYTVLEPKVVRLVASLKMQSATGEQPSP